METDNTKAESSQGPLTGMCRATKLFIKVDKEGYLIDSLAISDVVNFDCIESIVTSAKRIISLFTDVTPEEVDITTLFYYKKRARSLRMNPVRLTTTTDGFRAVAEHPSGEIPLGVEWGKRNPKSASKSLKNTGEKRSRSVSPAPTGQEKEVREKKMKLEVPAKYLTYMPTSTADAVSTKPATTTVTSDLEPPLLNVRQGQEDLAATQKGVNLKYQQIPGDQQPVQYIRHLTAEEIKKMQIQKIQKVQNLEENAKKGGEESTKRNPRQTKSQYHWTDDVSCEVILTYDGISERQKLKPQLGPVIQSLVKGDYSVLRSDLFQSMTADAKQWGQEMLNSFNHKDSDTQKPITYLSDAKMEVFKVLSLLCLSKARFKDLLDWMKTLKIEEGNQGKYYLSERNIIGGGLRVIYDTDEMAASKLSTLQKLRNSGKAKEKTKLLYPVTPLQSGLNTQKPGNFMIMVQNNNPLGAPVATTAVQSTNTKAFPKMQAGHTLVPIAPAPTADQPHPAWSKEVLNKPSDPKTSLVSILNKSKSVTSSTSSGTSTTESPKQTSRHPNILRSKTNFHSQKLVPPSGEPTPMHLYRSYKAGKDPENSRIDNYDPTDNDDTDTIPVIVKQEPLEYNSDTTEDGDSKHSQDEPPDKFKGVLNTDAEMPVDDLNNDLNMELVIKTEPVDDYGS